MASTESSWIGLAEAGNGRRRARRISTASCVAFTAPVRCGSTSEPVQAPWKSAWPLSATGRARFRSCNWARWAVDRESSQAIAGQAQVAQDGVELAQVAGVEIDGKRRRADERVSAQMAVGVQLAGGQIEFQLAQIDRAVALGVGGIDQAAGGDLSRCSLRGRREVEQGGDGESVFVALDPERVGRAVDAGVEAEMLKGRVADHLQQRIQATFLNCAVTLPLTGMVISSANGSASGHAA